MSSSITAGDRVLVTITKGRASDRGTFPAVAREHADVAGLIVADLDDREIVLQRPNGEQPFQVAPVSEPDLDDDTAAAWREDDLRTYYGIGR